MPTTASTRPPTDDQLLAEAREKIRTQDATIADLIDRVTNLETKLASIKVAEARTGPQGKQGAKGDRGEPGPQGTPGPRGPSGVSGPRGSTGPKGDTGPRGETGATGNPGPPGPQGERGEVGTPGPRGLTGNTGPQGERGPRGAQGAPGASSTPILRQRFVQREIPPGESTIDITWPTYQGGAFNDASYIVTATALTPHVEVTPISESRLSTGCKVLVSSRAKSPTVVGILVTAVR